LIGLATTLLFSNVSQSQTSANAPTFTARSELVMVPVIVTDNYGVHIHNLKKEDFNLLEDGKLQPLVSFEEFQESTRSPQRVSARPTEFSNHLLKDASPTQLIILVFDMVNTPIQDQNYARKELLEYLSDSSGRVSPMCLVAFTRRGIKVIGDFTTDPKTLAAGLKNLPPERQLVEEASREALPADRKLAALRQRQLEADQQREATELHTAVLITLQAMQQLAQYCAGLPGRKSMIWATDGFPFSISEMEETIKIVGPHSDSLADVSDLYRKTWKILNDAQVAVYPIDARGLDNPLLVNVEVSKPAAGFVDHNMWKSSETHGTFQQFASATGGKAFYNTNDLVNSFQVAADDNRSYYILSYHLDRQGKKPGWHRLEVRVRQSGINVRARTGFFLNSNPSPISEKNDLELAMGSPLDYTGIPITGLWQKVEPPTTEGKRKVVFVLTMPADFATIDESDHNHLVVEFVAIARTLTGVDVDQMSKTVEGHLNPDSVQQVRFNGLDYRGSLTLPPGEYTVRFAVQDHLSGRTGSVAAPLTIAP
jgi:VWFA-related protein